MRYFPSATILECSPTPDPVPGLQSGHAKLNGISYSQLIHGLKVAGIDLDRKILADLAVHDAPGFASLAEQAKAALSKTAA